MIGTLYISHATMDLSPEDLAKILRVSVANNPKRGITGVLMYHEGMFLQYLEGPEAQVAETLAVIKDDPRHRNMFVLINDQIAERHFPDWAMALADPTLMPPKDQDLCRRLHDAVSDHVTGVLKRQLQSLVSNFHRIADNRPR
ncbi:BLUF [Magnetospirillum sp. LM-5]|uniref:BLUF domain-containing protein n=1 Tax=Magnetospirillum sp. LM-5 TaxID=2681466 RepID=UPI0013850566|nr:BLUF domain-containing protein [Magnetospirillum sp. LM-5]CAA7622778.1 BLUF [Magnetospirillum sp. LM-5]